MKIDKSLQEVWDWKDSIYEETKHMTMHERVEYIKKGADEAHKKYKLNLREASLRNMSKQRQNRLAG